MANTIDLPPTALCTETWLRGCTSARAQWSTKPRNTNTIKYIYICIYIYTNTYKYSETRLWKKRSQILLVCREWTTWYNLPCLGLWNHGQIEQIPKANLQAQGAFRLQVNLLDHQLQSQLISTNCFDGQRTFGYIQQWAIVKITTIEWHKLCTPPKLGDCYWFYRGKKLVILFEM